MSVYTSAVSPLEDIGPTPILTCEGPPDLRTVLVLGRQTFWWILILSFWNVRPQFLHGTRPFVDLVTDPPSSLQNSIELVVGN